MRAGRFGFRDSRRARCRSSPKTGPFEELDHVGDTRDAAVFSCGAWLVATIAAQDRVTPVATDKFADPPLEFKSRPLWFWNKAGTTPDESVRS